jgi:hypothetical protein
MPTMTQPASTPGDGRGRHPPGRPCRRRQRPAGSAAGHHQRGHHPGRLWRAAGLGHPVWPGGRWGIEGTGSFGAALTRFLRA